MSDNDTVRDRPEGSRAESHVIWDDSAAAFSRWLSGEPGAMDELVHTMTPADLLTLADLLTAGTIAPVIHRTSPLSEAVDAVRMLESGDPRGKLVITP